MWGFPWWEGQGAGRNRRGRSSARRRIARIRPPPAPDAGALRAGLLLGGQEVGRRVLGGAGAAGGEDQGGEVVAVDLAAELLGGGIGTGRRRAGHLAAAQVARELPGQRPALPLHPEEVGRCGPGRPGCRYRPPPARRAGRATAALVATSRAARRLGPGRGGALAALGQLRRRALDEVVEDARREVAAADAVHGRIVVVADPDADDEVRRHADEPGIAIVLGRSGLAAHRQAGDPRALAGAAITTAWRESSIIARLSVGIALPPFVSARR